MTDGPVVLVGLMGAGKSTVGRRLAKRCGRPFLDLDEEIARRAGVPVREIFASGGETGFRELEARTTGEIAIGIADGESPIVAAGGGWMANRAARVALPAARTVWLKVGPAEAARRLASDPGGRPLLEAGDPAERLAALLAERLPAYGEAQYTVDTAGRTADDVVRRIVAVLGLPEEPAAE